MGSEETTILNALLEQWAAIAGIAASIVVVLGALVATARWAVRGAVDKALTSIREEIHEIDVRMVDRLSRLEGKVEVLSNAILPPETAPRKSGDD